MKKKKNLLKRIGEQRKAMKTKNKNEFRYTDAVLNTFCMLAFLTGGRRFYEIQIANFPGVYPSVRTIQTHLKKYDFSVPEGTLIVA